MTINLNGIRTIITKGKRRITKATALRLYAQGESLDFIGIQEPHLYTSEDVVSVQSIFDTGFYHFVCHHIETGRGRAAIAVHCRWTVKHSFTVNDRILVAIVANAEGQSLTIVTAHFDHHPEERKDQWVELHAALQTCHSDDTYLLADHNSLALPAQDAAKLPAKESPQVREARETELAILARLHLYDAWQEVHYDPATQEIPPGYTFGYNVHKRPQADRLRRLDKVHISARLKDSLAAAYSAFVAQAYHKAVVADLAPPVFVHPSPR